MVVAVAFAIAGGSRGRLYGACRHPMRCRRGGPARRQICGGPPKARHDRPLVGTAQPGLEKQVGSEHMQGTVVRAPRSMMAVPAALMTPEVVPKLVGAEAVVAPPW